MDKNTPVIVGVGQVLHRIADLDDVVEPLELMRRACQKAEADTGVVLLDKIESLRVIRGMWAYNNPAAWLVSEFGCTGAETVGTLFGGNYNQVVVSDTAAQIQAGERDLVLLTGAEIGYSSAKARKAGREIVMRETPKISYDHLYGTTQKPEHHDYEVAKGIRAAIHAYPLYDNAIRFARGETIPELLERVSGLWSRFSRVASRNPNAWIREPVAAEDIRTPSANNRPVSFPYTKLMNSNNAVDMGAALIVCSLGKARALGIDESRWVYPLAGVDGHDHFSASVRDNFYTSPGIRFIAERLYELTDTSADNIDLVDLYSCFPSAVQVAAREYGFDEARDLTVTGGLTFGGGPLNNYVMHSIARTVELLREHRDQTALVTANGGNLYKHAHGLYSGRPSDQPFARDNVQARIDALPSRNVLPTHTGDARIESYTVIYSAGGPAIGHLACLTEAGDRVWANVTDRDVLNAMPREEFCGRAVRLSGELPPQILD